MEGSEITGDIPYKGTQDCNHPSSIACFLSSVPTMMECFTAGNGTRWLETEISETVSKNPISLHINWQISGISYYNAKFVNKLYKGTQG